MSILVLLIFLTSFVFTLVFHLHFHLSLIVSLLLVLLYIIYHYYLRAATNLAAFVSLSVCLLVYINLLFLSRPSLFDRLHIPLYFLLLYYFLSFQEWFLHKYVMHCYMNTPILYNSTSDNMLIKRVRASCTSHHSHHMNTGPDMHMYSEVVDKKELYFNWFLVGIIIVLAGILLYFFILLIRLRVSLPFHVLCVVISIVIYSFVWNTLHPSMHSLHLDIPLTEGAPCLAYDIKKGNILYKNHFAHHQVKGPAKGNYNIILLGADVIMSTDRL